MILKKTTYVINAEALENFRRHNEGLYQFLYELMLKLIEPDFQKLHDNQQYIIVNTLKKYNIFILEDQNNKGIESESVADFFQIEKNSADLPEHDEDNYI
jgi:hypothetical protein